jgi:outer membrane protein OmpA-like peptidoglycan-associated protein
LVASTATAQVDVERFKPAVTYDGFVTAETSSTRDAGDRWSFGAYLNYQRNPLVITDANGDVIGTYVNGRMGLDLTAAATVAGPFSIGLALPVYAIQTGDFDPSFGGLGDLRVVPKLRILDNRDGVGLALAVELRAPTHTGDFSGGARGLIAHPKAILDHLFGNGLHFGLNLGALLKQSDTFGNVTSASEFTYAAALGYRFGGRKGKTEIGAEAAGGVGLAATQSEEVPLELFFYVRHQFNPDWEIIGGPALGLLEGFGVPIARGFVGVRYTPTSHDSDGDGVSDPQDKCPAVAEDIDGDRDSDGCPEEDPDADQDGVPDKHDDCPGAKETIIGVDDDDGCPDTGDPRVIYEDGELQILDAVRFEHGSSTISEESDSLLNQVALMMKANPQIKKVRVEGHTDSSGPADVNRRLSEQRAEAVRNRLIRNGVAETRLEAKGCGEDRPKVKGDEPEASAKNRRVEFIVKQ